MIWLILIVLFIALFVIPVGLYGLAVLWLYINTWPVAVVLLLIVVGVIIERKRSAKARVDYESRRDELIRSRHAAGETATALARAYGLTVTEIEKICSQS